MQVTSAQFDALANAQVRKIAWQLRMSWDKTFDPDVTFFTLDTSLLDGPDVLPPSDDNVVQEWDKYLYSDFSNRVIQMEWQRQEDFPYSVNEAMADITLNNYDDYFTRGSGSPLGEDILPRRPVRILSGFNNETLPQFVGLTTAVPTVDKSSGIAKLHCVDFLSFLFNKPLDETVLLENVRTDEVLDYLFQLFGLAPEQYVLDEGHNTIKFVFFQKGEKLGTAVKDLMQAELGSLFMDELGVIRFKNRLNISTTPVMSLDESRIINYEVSDESTIINVVEIKADVREVLPTSTIYTINKPFVLAPGSNEIFFALDDPITSMEPVSFYAANSLEDGSGTDVTASVSVTDTDVFADSAKVTFNNSTGQTAYLIDITLYGTPARVVRNIYLREEDEDSITDFEEQPFEITNNFIQDDDTANSIAQTLLHYYKSYGNTIELTIKGTPALQVSDYIHVTIDNIEQDYGITKIVDILDAPGVFTQRISARVFNTADYFTLSSDSEDRSLLDGEDILAP